LNPDQLLAEHGKRSITSSQLPRRLNGLRPAGISLLLPIEIAPPLRERSFSLNTRLIQADLFAPESG